MSDYLSYLSSTFHLFNIYSIITLSSTFHLFNIYSIITYIIIFSACIFIPYIFEIFSYFKYFHLMYFSCIFDVYCEVHINKLELPCSSTNCDNQPHNTTDSVTYVL